MTEFFLAEIKNKVTKNIMELLIERYSSKLSTFKKDAVFKVYEITSREGTLETNLFANSITEKDQTIKKTNSDCKQCKYYTICGKMNDSNDNTIEAMLINILAKFKKYDYECNKKKEIKNIKLENRSFQIIRVSIVDLRNNIEHNKVTIWEREGKKWIS